MLNDKVIGHITLRVPIHLIEDQESWEIPQTYTYLEAGDAELVSHDIPVAHHDFFRETLEDSGGLQIGTWGAAELAATTLLHEHPLPAEPLLDIEGDLQRALNLKSVQ